MTNECPDLLDANQVEEQADHHSHSNPYSRVYRSVPVLHHCCHGRILGTYKHGCRIEVSLCAQVSACFERQTSRLGQIAVPHSGGHIPNP